MFLLVPPNLCFLRKGVGTKALKLETIKEFKGNIV